MHGTLSCPLCGTTNIALGATACPHCAVGFASPVVTPTLERTLVHAPAPPSTTATAVASTPADTWSPHIHAPGSVPAPDSTSVTYGSIWRRLLAAIIDFAIVGIPFLLVVGPTEYFRFAEDSDGFSWMVYSEPWEYLEALAFFVYVAVMQSSPKQATFGMQALDMRIVHEDDHGQLSFARAAGRELLTYLSVLILFIGYLMIAFTAKRQALHDKLARTVVLHDRAR